MLLLILIIIVGILTYYVMNLEEVKNAVADDNNFKTMREKYLKNLFKNRNNKNMDMPYGKEWRRKKKEEYYSNGDNSNVTNSSMRWNYLILFIASCVISTIAYWFVYKGVLNHIADSYTSAELDYYAYLYGNSFGNYILGISEGMMKSIYKVVMDVAMVVILVSGVFYKRTTNKKIDKRCCIFFFIALGVICGTLIFRYLLFQK